MTEQTVTLAPAAPTQPRGPVRTPPPVDASAATSRAHWLQLMEDVTEEDGYLEPLGSRHWAFFLDDEPTLLVTFERLEDIRARPNQMPAGFDIAKANGWSFLCLIAEGETWYRDNRVYGYFDRLVDDAFFEDFDDVLFHGAGSQGYAATAFAVAAPGAAVLAICPRATLTPAIAGWDKRDRAGRRLDFTSRYGYAPDMVDGAGRVFVLHDPGQAEDAMHSALFRGRHITHLRTPHLGGRVEWSLTHMQLIQPLIEAAMNDELSVVNFARIWRGRRSFGPYLRGLLAQAEAGNRPKLQKMICRNVNSRLQAPRFRKRLADLLAAEAVAEAEAAARLL